MFMSRLFVMEDLRSLAARALASGDYTPAESARVRAVPDTRTIRYYTTLGLLKPPAEMRGRTALYSETHVLQIVAIKRLQAQDLTLSDIQRRLIGLTNSRLAAIAKLPDGFWQAADEYLKKKSQSKPAKTEVASSGIVAESSPPCSPFWLTPAALPMALGESNEDSDNGLKVHATVELQLAVGVSLHIQFPSTAAASRALDTVALRAAAAPLLKELTRQNIQWS